MAHKSQKKIDRGTILRLMMLLIFIVLVITFVILIWPHVSEITESGGLQKLIDQVRGFGAFGAIVLFAVQIIQVISGFIPSEMLAIVSGLIYGTWFGTLIVIAGCAVGTIIVFLIVRKLGAPFVRSMVPKKYLNKFNKLEQGERFYTFVFILFLIPGIPKDVLTYIVPLSSIPLPHFVAVATLGRLPELFAVICAASDIANGQYVRAIIIFSITAIVAIVGLIVYNRTAKRPTRTSH